MLVFTAIFVGGGLGAVARSIVGRAVQGQLAFPVGTLVVNASGCLVFGLLTGLLAGRLPEAAQLFVFTGVLGGYTTFSTFSHETATLLRQAPARGALYVILSVGLSLAGVMIGAWIGGSLRAQPPAAAASTR